MSDLSLDDPVLLQLGPIPITGSLATSAGITFALSVGSWLATPRLQLVLLGVAAGAAAVMAPGTQLCRRADVERLHAAMGATSQ